MNLFRGLTPSTRRRARELFGLDLRSAALFRILLAALTLWDLAQRMAWLGAHYTANGILPADGLRGQMESTPWHFMFFYVQDHGVWAGAGLGIGILAAAGLLLGWRTRLMTLVCWVVVCSIQIRNPAILHAGDTLHRLLLFWAMFLPLGARFSIDAALNTLPRRTLPRFVFSGGTFGITLQIALIYWVTGAVKLGESSWREGSHLATVLQYQHLTTPLSEWLLATGPLLTWLTWGTIALELLLPFLFFCPWKFGLIRSLAIALLAGFQILLLATLEIGLFPLLNLTALMVLLPGWFWGAAFHERLKKVPTGWTIFYDGDCGFCRKGVHLLRTFLFLGRVRILPSATDPAMEREMEEANSWILRSPNAQTHHRFEAFSVLVSLSPFWGWTAPLLKPRRVKRPGDLLYKWVAANRHLCSLLLRPLTFRPSPWQLPRWAGAIALVCAGYILLLNLFPLFGGPGARWMKAPAYQLRLDQNWEVFLRPAPHAGTLRAIGILADGREIDLLHGGVPFQPELVPAGRGNLEHYRWRFYFTHLIHNPARFGPMREQFAGWLARETEPALAGVRLEYAFISLDAPSDAEYQRALLGEFPISPQPGVAGAKRLY